MFKEGEVMRAETKRDNFIFELFKEKIMNMSHGGLRGHRPQIKSLPVAKVDFYHRLINIVSLSNHLKSVTSLIMFYSLMTYSS